MRKKFISTTGSALLLSVLFYSAFAYVAKSIDLNDAFSMGIPSGNDHGISEIQGNTEDDGSSTLSSLDILGDEGWAVTPNLTVDNDLGLGPTSTIEEREDAIQSTMRTTIIRYKNGYAIHGENAVPDNNGELLTSTQIIPEFGYAYSGDILLATLGGDGSLTQFFISFNRWTMGMGFPRIVDFRSVDNWDNQE